MAASITSAVSGWRIDCRCPRERQRDEDAAMCRRTRARDPAGHRSEEDHQPSLQLAVPAVGTRCQRVVIVVRTFDCKSRLHRDLDATAKIETELRVARIEVIQAGTAVDEQARGGERVERVLRVPDHVPDVSVTVACGSVETGDADANV